MESGSFAQPNVVASLAREEERRIKPFLQYIKEMALLSQSHEFVGKNCDNPAARIEYLNLEFNAIDLYKLFGVGRITHREVLDRVLKPLDEICERNEGRLFTAKELCREDTTHHWLVGNYFVTNWVRGGDKPWARTEILYLSGDKDHNGIVNELFRLYCQGGLSSGGTAVPKTLIKPVIQLESSFAAEDAQLAESPEISFQKAIAYLSVIPDTRSTRAGKSIPCFAAT